MPSKINSQRSEWGGLMTMALLRLRRGKDTTAFGNADALLNSQWAKFMNWSLLCAPILYRAAQRHADCLRLTTSAVHSLLNRSTILPSERFWNLEL